MLELSVDVDPQILVAVHSLDEVFDLNYSKHVGACVERWFHLKLLPNGKPNARVKFAIFIHVPSVSEVAIFGPAYVRRLGTERPNVDRHPLEMTKIKNFWSKWPSWALGAFFYLLSAHIVIVSRLKCASGAVLALVSQWVSVFTSSTASALQNLLLGEFYGGRCCRIAGLRLVPVELLHSVVLICITFWNIESVVRFFAWLSRLARTATNWSGDWELVLLAWETLSSCRGQIVKVLVCKALPTPVLLLICHTFVAMLALPWTIRNSRYFNVLNFSCEILFVTLQSKVIVSLVHPLELVHPRSDVSWYSGPNPRS